MGKRVSRCSKAQAAQSANGRSRLLVPTNGNTEGGGRVLLTTVKWIAARLGCTTALPMLRMGCSIGQQARGCLQTALPSSGTRLQAAGGTAAES